jgi:hypothetical protein
MINKCVIYKLKKTFTIRTNLIGWMVGWVFIFLINTLGHLEIFPQSIWHKIVNNVNKLKISLIFCAWMSMQIRRNVLTKQNNV